MSYPHKPPAPIASLPQEPPYSELRTVCQGRPFLDDFFPTQGRLQEQGKFALHAV